MKYITIALLCMFSVLRGNTQELLTGTAGEYFETGNLSLSWSLGEVLTETFNTDKLYLTQGFQQEYDIETSIIQKLEKGLQVKLYPNPVTNSLIIEYIDHQKPTNHRLEMFDISGRLIQVRENLEVINKIDVEHINSGTYFIRIIDLQEKSIQILIFEKIKI